MLKSNAKFREKQTYGFKCDMKDLVNFYAPTQTSESFTLVDYLCPKYVKFELKKYRGVLFQDTEP